MSTSVPAALSSSVVMQRDGRLWSQTLSLGSPRRINVVVVDSYLCSNPNFSNVKFVNYVFIQTWFEIFIVESCVYCCIFKYVSCLYHLRSLSRETIGVVSIETWAEKELSN